MSHSDHHLSEDELALRALGEPLPPASTEHLLTCQHCSAEFDAYTNVVNTARSIGPADAPSDPSPEVWARIRDELDLDKGEVEVSPTPDTVAVLHPAGTTSSTRQRRWPTSILIAASVAGVLAGGVLAFGGSALVNDNPSPPIASPSPDVVGTASLVALPDHQGSGKAEIIQTSRGPELVVDVDSLTPSDGFYEVWLIDPKTFQMVGLGALNNNAGRFPIPDGLDLSKYRIIDVSIEPYDGNPLHSKNSVVRGEISA